MRLLLHAANPDAPFTGTRNPVTSEEYHYHILHVGLPQLLAACPGVALRLHITGDSPFLDCEFLLQVPQAHMPITFAHAGL